MTRTIYHRVNSGPRNRDENMIPLINIVFLLLVFYMIAGEITALTNEQIDPPISNSDETLNSTAVSLVLHSDHSLRINGVRVELESLDSEILDKLNAVPGHVVLKADKHVKASALDHLLSTLQRNHVTTITLFGRTEGSGS